MAALQRLRDAIGRAFSPSQPTRQKSHPRFGGALLTLAALVMMCAPHVADAQTYNYAGAPLSAAVDNPASCPADIGSITAVVRFLPQSPFREAILTVAGVSMRAINNPNQWISVGSDGTVVAANLASETGFAPNDQIIVSNNGSLDGTMPRTLPSIRSPPSGSIGMP